jgi:energy-coupling factor transport system permease protein
LAQSFFLPRTSGLHALHPLTKLTLVAGLLLVGFAAASPNIPLALFICLVLPLALWGQIVREVLRVTLVVLLPFVLSVTLMQGLYYPGTQVILTFGPLSLRLEGLALAYATSARLLLLAGTALVLLFSTNPADLILALRQRGLPGALAYVAVAAIQLLPQLQARAFAILDAQRSRGLETEGRLFRRVRALIPLVSPLAFSALADVDERAMALEARAFSTARPKTSFKELRDTRAQAVGRWLLLGAAIIIAALEVRGQ